MTKCTASQCRCFKKGHTLIFQQGLDAGIRNCSDATGEVKCKLKEKGGE